MEILLLIRSLLFMVTDNVKHFLGVYRRKHLVQELSERERKGHTHVGETLVEIESQQHGVALGETSGLLVRFLDSW